YEIPESKVLVDTSEESIQNGKRLSLARGCADCHGENMGGKKVIDAPPAGVLFGSNLTRGKGGIGNELTDESIIKAIHNGVGRNGKALKWMPSEEYTGLSAEELSNLVAYIKSVPPVDNQTTPSGYGFITSILLWKGDIKLAAEVIDHSKIPTKGIVPEITKEYGEYLANTCKGCHGPGFSGGAIPGVPPDFPEAANITSDTENGIGKYKEEDFITAMTKGKRPDGSEINPFMPYKNFSNMTEVELKALWVYVKDIPPKKEKSR
ncbi:MAG: c-type cytochrome, partial [Leptospiraceae bacterium]|nr:c-type cytochrome [Leptospiraceae bacterium]